VKNLTDLPERQNALYHGNTLESLESHCQSLYTNLCTFLQDRLIESGVDKFTARKQARGAARGCLGSCLGTEYVFSASIAEWKHIILSRGNNAADAEIRLIANEIFDYLAPRHPEIFGNCTKQVAIDGFGYHIEQK
jgi:thymidylate synthase ThyX